MKSPEELDKEAYSILRHGKIFDVAKILHQNELLKMAVLDLLTHSAPKIDQEWAEYNEEFEASKDRARKILHKIKIG
jgi:predicted transcriptional regulator